MYPSGPAFGLAYQASLLLASVPEGGLRFYGAGDASVGGWVLGLNVTHQEEHRFCHHDCQANTIAYYDTTKCNGLCDPLNQLPQMMSSTCWTEPAIPRGYTSLPWDPDGEFDHGKERCAKLFSDHLDQSDCRRP